MKPLRAVCAILGITILAGCAIATPGPLPAGSFTARVVHVDAFDGFMIVEGPTGRSFVMVGNREADNYRVGDIVVLDSAWRPRGRGQEPAGVSQPLTPARRAGDPHRGAGPARTVAPSTG